MVHNLPKKNVFVKLQVFGGTSIEIEKFENLQKLFSDIDVL